MGTDQEFWERMVAALSCSVMEAALSNKDVVNYLVSRRKTTPEFVAEITAATADLLLNERNKRIQGHPLEEKELSS